MSLSFNEALFITVRRCNETSVQRQSSFPTIIDVLLWDSVNFEILYALKTKHFQFKSIYLLTQN